MRDSCSMALMTISSMPSASRILTGGSVVFMALTMAKVRVRAVSTSRTWLTVQSRAQETVLKPTDGWGWEDSVS